jgi:hypothetical protein
MRAAGWATIVGAVALAMGAGACAQILGYDDLQARTNESPDSGPPPTDTLVDDTTPDAEPEAETGEEPARPPARPPGPPTPSGKGRDVWLIAKHFYLGTQTLAGDPSKDAWKDWGYDLDHVCTDRDASIANTGTCIRNKDAKPDVLTDGNACRDNNWGSQLLPLVSLYDSVFEQVGNDAILKGVNTWILVLHDLDDGPTDTYVPGALYVAAFWADYGKTTPLFDGTDVRQVDSDSVIGYDVSKPKTYFPHGFVVGDTWVSGDGEDIVAAVPIATVKTDFHMVDGVLTLPLTADHTSGTIGLLAGAIQSTTFDSLLEPVAAAAGFCKGSSLYTALQAKLLQYVDVVAGAPNLQDVTKPCDSMSVGFGFTVVPIKPVTTAVDEYKPPTPCDDAGTDGDAGAGGG